MGGRGCTFMHAGAPVSNYWRSRRQVNSCEKEVRGARVGARNILPDLGMYTHSCYTCAPRWYPSGIEARARSDAAPPIRHRRDAASSSEAQRTSRRLHWPCGVRSSRAGRIRCVRRMTSPPARRLTSSTPASAGGPCIRHNRPIVQRASSSASRSAAAPSC